MKKQQLSECNQWLTEQCQRLNFGQITFSVRAGEPDPGRPWRTRRIVKLGSGENGPRVEANLADFELCQEQVALFDALRRVGDGETVTVEVRHGLPFLVEIEQALDTAAAAERQGPESGPRASLVPPSQGQDHMAA